MITSLELTSPLSDQVAGTIAIGFSLISDSEPVNFSDSFRVWINDLEYLDFTPVNEEGVWIVDFNIDLMGPQLVKLTFTAKDNDKPTTENWVFSIGSEVTLSEEVSYRAPFADSLLEYLPEYTKARGEKSSVFRQLMNPLGNELDGIKQRLSVRNRALNINKADIQDPDWLYQFNLQAGDQFTLALDSADNEVFVPPTVWGLKGFNRLGLGIRNTFKDFWGRALPTRFTSESLGTINTQLTGSVSLHGVSEIEAFDVPLHSQLYVWIHSLANSIELIDGETFIAQLILTGQGPEGRPQEESISLLSNRVFITNKSWSRVTKIRTLLGPDDLLGEVVIFNIPPRSSDKFDPLIKQEGSSVRWKLGGDAGSSFIERQVSGQGYLLDLIKGEDNFITVDLQRLADTNSDLVTITDFAIDHSSHRLYGINSTDLFIWDRRDRLPSNILEMNAAVEDPEVDFFIIRFTQSEHIDGENLSDLSIEIDKSRGIKTIEKWHWTLVDDNGTRHYLDEDYSPGAPAPFWIFNPLPIRSFGISQRNFEISTSLTGTLIFELNVKFMDGGEEVVKKMVQIQEKKAIAQYKIDHLFSGSGVNRIAMLEDGRLVLVNKGSSWSLTPMYDTFMVDFESNTVLFREQFDSVEVDFNES